MHRLDPKRELEQLRGFLAESDPHDYLLDDLDEWVCSGRLWVGVEGGEWVAFGRIHDLDHGEGWVSGLRVARTRRGQGLGSQLLSGLASDGLSVGIQELRAVIEEENHASRRLFARHGFRPIFEMSLRRASAGAKSGPALRPARTGYRLGGSVGWIPGQTGRVDLLPGSEGGRFGRWDPSVLDRWVQEGKLYVGPQLAAAVQANWLREPRTMWVNPLQGEPESLLPAIATLAGALGQDEWQAYLPSTEPLRQVYANLGLSRHALWGDRIHLYERIETSSRST